MGYYSNPAVWGNPWATPKGMSSLNLHLTLSRLADTLCVFRGDRVIWLLPSGNWPVSTIRSRPTSGYAGSRSNYFNKRAGPMGSFGIGGQPPKGLSG